MSRADKLSLSILFPLAGYLIALAVEIQEYVRLL